MIIRIIVAVLALATLPALAENIDPLDDGSQFAWGENVGWVNAEPGGDGADGVQVSDFEVTGWMWGENIGWISLSCKTTGSCERVPYGIVHDGLGNLYGLAWAENAGWIDFDPQGDAHVTVDVADGTFLGHAWGENIGWITMSSAGANPHRVRTAWSCDPPPAPPIHAPWLVLEGTAGTETVLSWDPILDATGYDVVYGWISALPAGLAVATIGCVGENVTGYAAGSYDIPPPGDGYWFLVRGVNCGHGGTYDTAGSGLAGPRDDAIAASSLDCAVP